MKKQLMMAAVGAMAFCAQASVSYQVEINRIEQGSALLPAGWIPSSISLALKDDTKSVQLLTDSINFYTIFKDTAFDTTDYFTADHGLVNVVALLKAKATSFTTKENVSLLLSDEINGVTLTYKKDAGGSSEVFPGCTSDAEASQYAKDHLTTVLSASVNGQSKTYELPAVYNTDGATQLGTRLQLSAVPEPTSSMLVFLGLAGLMLKRRRVA